MIAPGPGTDGVEATRRISALRAGASGFLVEGAESRELVDALRIVAPGSSVVAPRVVRRMLDLFATHLPAELGPRDRVQAVIAADESGLAGSGGSGGPRP